MKHSIAVKFIAIALCALSVVSIAAGGIGIICMEAYDLYDQTLEEYKSSQLDATANAIAWELAEQYAADELGNCPSDILDSITSGYYTYYSPIYAYYHAEVYDDGQVVHEIGNSDLSGDLWTADLTVAPYYPIVSYQYTVSPDGSEMAADITEAVDDGVGYMATAPVMDEDVTAPTEAPMEEEDLPDTTSWSEELDEAMAKVAGQDVIFSSIHSENFHGENGYYEIVYNLDYYQGPEYRVVVTMIPDKVLGANFALMSLLYGFSSYFLPAILAGLLVFAVTMVYLCVAAGRTKGGEIHPAGLNRIPLDLYAIVAVSGCVLLACPIVWAIESAQFYDGGILDHAELVVAMIGLCVFGIALMIIGFLYAFAAQVKVKGGYWWRHSVCGWCLTQVGNFLRWVRRGLRSVGRGIRAVFGMLPVIWQWLLTAAGMAFVLLVTFALTFGNSYFRTNGFFLLVLLAELVLCVAIVLYGAWCFGLLLKGAKAMSQGNLNKKIPTKYLFGCFKDFAEQLNNLAGAAQIAAQRQMKSERMKTELITNVSHDIKTPLTSIINYVDLLKKPHTESEGEQYLEVLDRQSQRLKKLIDDLMEMSKANTGNLTVELGRVDAVEAVNQALGEFADKLASVNLTPVFRYPDTPVTMMADGRLVWRVLSNILSNAVKYALPDTRLYVDLMVLQGNAVIAIKNISRDQLNVNADELMERFVRGDSSRNTEGSGLGLNIAKSLVELQHGQMHLMVDGDLFKVTLIFPCA